MSYQELNSRFEYTNPDISQTKRNDIYNVLDAIEWICSFPSSAKRHILEDKVGMLEHIEKSYLNGHIRDRAAVERAISSLNILRVALRGALPRLYPIEGSRDESNLHSFYYRSTN